MSLSLVPPEPFLFLLTPGVVDLLFIYHGYGNRHGNRYTEIGWDLFVNRNTLNRHDHLVITSPHKNLSGDRFHMKAFKGWYEFGGFNRPGLLYGLKKKFRTYVITSTETGWYRVFSAFAQFFPAIYVIDTFFQRVRIKPGVAGMAPRAASGFSRATVASARAGPKTTAFTPNSRRCFNRTLMSRPQSAVRRTSAPDIFTLVRKGERSFDMRGGNLPRRSESRESAVPVPF